MGIRLRRIPLRASRFHSRWRDGKLLRPGLRAGIASFPGPELGGYLYCTIVLKKSGDMLSGFYSSSVPYDRADQAAVTLRRIGD